MGEYYIGLDVGGTKCAVLLAEVNHGIHIRDKLRFATCTEKGFHYAWENLCKGMEDILARNGKTFADIRAVGVSCGGPLDSRRGLVLSPPNLPGWDEIPLPKMITDRYHVPAFIQNDANACALVEWKLGAGRGTTNMIFLTMGTGMGAGVIAEGQLLCGNTDMGGEVGHIRLTEDGPVGFGKAGSFEGYTSGGGIGRQAVAITEEYIAEGNPPAWIRDGHTIEEVDPKLIADYARKGDRDALAFWQFIGSMLGRGVAQIVDVLNPECIVIGSIFVRCEDLLRPAMEAELHREAIVHSVKGLRVVPAETGEALGDLASIMVALHNLGVDPIETGDETKETVLAHFQRLFERYPALESCRESVMQAYIILRDSYMHGGKLMVGGNGGSCADSEHIVGELMKGFYLKRPVSAQRKAALSAMDAILPGASGLMQQGLPALALTGHAGLSTAVANDMDPLLAMAQQVLASHKPHDVVMGISTSGNAKNVALAVSCGKALGLKTIGLTGGKGGRLAELCDVAIIAPANTPADVQEYHLPIYHTLCAMIEAKFFDE